MRFLGIFLIALIYSGSVQAQKTIAKTLKKFNTESVPYISVEEAILTKNSLFLDTRKREEYDVSHVKDALWVGYKKFSIGDVLAQIPVKDTPIIVYCSVGVRSEDIGEKLLKAGYTNVKNLYGGIFNWKNKGNPVFSNDGMPTEKVHGFSKQWGKLLTNAQKVY